MKTSLETPRLLLREMTTADAPEVFANWTHSERVAKYVTWKAHTSCEMTEKYLRAEEKAQRESWGIVIKETNQLIGTISVIQEKPRCQSKTLGYVLGEAFWNHGYMSEALASVITYLFTTTAVNRIEAEHDTKNPASGRVMTKAGMVFEGVLREADWNNQGIVDVAMYSILRSDFETLKKERAITDNRL